VHGGFEGTDTRFSFYFPAKETYRGRMFQPLEGAHAGHEDAFAGPMGQMLGGLQLIGERLGGYMVESNSGHIGDDIDKRAGDDPGTFFQARGCAGVWQSTAIFVRLGRQRGRPALAWMS
jgi:hypothetical protein